MIEAIHATESHRRMARTAEERSTVTFRILEEQVIGILLQWDKADTQRLFKTRGTGNVTNLADAVERARNRVFGFDTLSNRLDFERRTASRRWAKYYERRGREPVAADIAFHGDRQND
jgi:hypothetical protein